MLLALVMLLALGVDALAGPLQDDDSALHQVTGTVGTTVSGLFLGPIAAINIDGPIYPFMTEMYMRAANVVGERERSLTYLDNTLARYTKDGFNGWSFLDWSLKPRLGEAWFPSNANAAGGVYSSMLGI